YWSVTGVQTCALPICDHVGRTNPAMTEPGKTRAFPTRIEAPDVLGRFGTDNGQQPIDRLEHAADTAERQRRGAKADDFPIVCTRSEERRVGKECRGAW